MTDRDREAFEAWFKTADRVVLDRYWAEEAWEAALAHAREAGAQEPVAVPAGFKLAWVPDYPEGDVIGPCICGSWSGGKCLHCPVQNQPAAPVSPAADSGESSLREAVRKAIAVAGEDHTGCNPQMVAKRISDLLKDALARTPAPQPGGAVKVKALEWRDEEPAVSTLYTQISDSIVGRYAVTPINGAAYLNNKLIISDEASQAAAQADYERRILSALSPFPSGWDAGAGADDWREQAAELVEKLADEGYCVSWIADQIRALPLPTPQAGEGR